MHTLTARAPPPKNNCKKTKRIKRPLTGCGELSFPVVAEPEHLQLPAEGVDVGVRRHLRKTHKRYVCTDNSDGAGLYFLTNTGPTASARVGVVLHQQNHGASQK